MNDNVEELKKQAMEIYVYTDYYGDKDCVMRLNEEKFADLIVNEASKVCATKYWNDDVTSRNIGLMFADDIKKHFGL